MKEGCCLKMGCEQSVSGPSHSDVLERWQLDVSALLRFDDTLNQPATWTLLVHTGWLSRKEKKNPLKWKRCHYELTRSTSRSANGSDFSQVRCYTVIWFEILTVILLPCSQHKLTNIKDRCFLHHKTARSFSVPEEEKKPHQTYHSKTPHGCT